MSAVSHRSENLTFSVGLMSPQSKSSACNRISPNLTITDTDLILMNMIARCLQSSGRPKTVKTGRLAFESLASE
jgi:hypothetical protein